MNQAAKYQKNWKTVTPPLYTGKIFQINHERGTGLIKTAIGEEVFFKFSDTTDGRMQVGYYVTFEKRPFIHQLNKFYAVTVKRAYLSQDGFYVIDGSPSHVHRDLKISLSMIIKRISCQNRYYISENLSFSFSVGNQSCVRVTWEDEIFYAKRVGRDGFWKFVKNQIGAPINNVTVFLRKYQSIYLIMSCHSGKKSERPPYDDMALEENNPFWEDHALVYDPYSVYADTITTINPWTGVDERNTLAALNRGLSDSLG